MRQHLINVAQMSGMLLGMIAPCICLVSKDAAAQPRPTPPKGSVALTASMTIGEVLTVTKGGPRRPIIEHETLLSVPVTIKLQPFLGGRRSGPVDVIVCAADRLGECPDVYGPGVTGADRTFLNVNSDKSVTATLSIPAPTAGAKSRLRLNLCQLPTAPNKCESLLATAESNELKVAARYRVTISDINALTIASPNADILWVGLDAVVHGGRCTPATCKQNAPDPTHWPNEIFSPADSSQGSHYRTFMAVGPFTLVPQLDPDIIVSFAVFNFGADYDPITIDAIHGKIRDVLEADLSLGEDSADPKGLMGGFRSSNPPSWNGCDGPLAAGWVRLHNSGDDDIATKTSGGAAFQPPETAVLYAGISRGGDCKASQYRLTLNLERSSKP